MGEEQAGFRVTGAVQGVGFRWWTTRTAQQLGLRGAVKNQSDGSVEVHVIGPSQAVAALERRLAEGPAGARVKRVERTASSLPIPPSGFNIER